MPYRTPASPIDEVLMKKLARAIDIARESYELSAHPNYHDATSIAILATKIFDKLPNDEE